MARIIITGANRGLGKHAAELLANAGHSLILACRNITAAEESCRTLHTKCGNRDIHAMKLDLTDRASIRDFVSDFRKRFADLDILINNAGIITQKAGWTPEGLELTSATNYFGHYLLTRLLLPCFSSGNGDKRIVNLVSVIYPYGRAYRFECLHRYRWVRAYAVSKYMILQSTLALAESLKSRGICVNAVDPGIVNTSIMFTQKWYDSIINLILRPFYIPYADGAARICEVALAPELRHVSGCCFRKGNALPLKKSDADTRALNNLITTTDALLGLDPL
ncbi:MAG: SDR family NAD(P)-dependent oxidoreductase [Candidatus Neomarinimicrobiota bacterium]|jgi:NAD(P)-dependent dehydrogenase (short-subunit alcohol dehydrogenase family)|nr:SDR family NAD(P)-dependent oxidoreductase [Candidatus Neomarinimicrobiota bacterium]MDD3966185.1 SDR family NAD(P)-dependent oxidoreductase [Candidatus Neomarinimicrobiota bacterium]MDD4961604.1 SDR family NAD(P)-dependent oxidoreductase [Candidatus Neomarinimicrobiota bacterium]MDD5710238.1 SDR family NAD(P)-dependent oxidoreductase [Candidatus Neomarinimicrobiota bacterium]